jgi:hypothetical protein
MGAGILALMLILAFLSRNDCVNRWFAMSYMRNMTERRNQSTGSVEQLPFA